jgi:hypothetical protein
MGIKGLVSARSGHLKELLSCDGRRSRMFALGQIHPSRGTEIDKKTHV